MLSARQDLLRIVDSWRLSKGRFGKYGKLDVGRRGAIRKPSVMPQPCAAAKAVLIGPLTYLPNVLHDRAAHLYDSQNAVIWLHPTSH